MAWGPTVAKHWKSWEYSLSLDSLKNIKRDVKSQNINGQEKFDDKIE